MEVVGRGMAVLMARIRPSSLLYNAKTLLNNAKGRAGEWAVRSTTWPPVVFVLRLVHRLTEQVRSRPYLMRIANTVVQLARACVDRRRCVVRCVLCVMVTVALLAHVLGFSTPWWIFIEGHYAEPCSHVKGLWEVCIMTTRGVIDACETSFQLEKDHPPSSFVNSCGQRSLIGLKMTTVRVLESLGLVLATLSEILLLQYLMAKSRQRRTTTRTLLPLALCMLAAGALILAGFAVCQKEVALTNRPDDVMYLDWSSYVSWSAGWMFILCAVMSLFL